MTARRAGPHPGGGIGLPRARFIRNLKPDAVQAAMVGQSTLSAFLIPPNNNACGQALEIAHYVRDHSLDVLAENGNFTDPDRLQVRVTNIVRDYQSHTTLTFANALGLSLRLALGQQ
ncbi:hypothetical protein AB0K08_16165 [Citricoccus sp. NPDC055426]|uniref:hypothetical protein n=1 Tax=Citricoccus sp. NPDC055426 TaxID=3155536 RepID=UPI00343EC1FF